MNQPPQNAATPTAATFKLTSDDVATFCRKHQLAMRWQEIATEDYIASRCCVVNGLFSGFPIAEQSAEKFLKAFLQFLDPNAQPRKFSHDLHELVAEVERRTGANLNAYSRTFEKLEQHYAGRYPDGTKPMRAGVVPMKGASSAEIGEVDELIVHLVRQMPIPQEVKLGSGVFAVATSSNLRNGMVMPNERWLMTRNEPLKKILPDIIAQRRALLEFHGRTPGVEPTESWLLDVGV